MEIHRSGWFVCFGFLAHAVKIINNITSCVTHEKDYWSFPSSLTLIAFFGYGFGTFSSIAHTNFFFD